MSMSLSIFFQAFATTFAMLCDIGPICMTVINTTIIYGFRIGIFAGLGVFCADAIYIIIASLAISSLESILSSKVVVVIGLCGGLFLYYLAYRFWTAKPSLNGKEITGSKIKSFFALFGLTIIGPTTIITYSIVFSSFLGKGNFSAFSAILGGLLGTFSFYTILVSVLGIVRNKINKKFIVILNKFATVVICILATALMYNGLKSLFA